MSRRSSRSKTVALEASPASIPRFEEFIDGLELLSPAERNRLKLAGGEILDNIIKHASPVAARRIRARVSARRASGQGGSILLSFFFRSPGFAAFASSGSPWSIDAEPLFDPAHRRWRGIGLLMCRNLAKRVALRPGTSMDRIFLEFDAEIQ